MARKGFLPWIRVDVDLPDHGKTMLLNARLKLENAHVYPFNVWCWAAQHAPDGNVKARTTVELIRIIEDAARWKGKRGVLFSALLSTGFIDGLNRPLRWAVIHKWDDLQGAHQRHAASGAERVRTFRANQKEKRLREAFEKSLENAQPGETTGPNGDVTVTVPVTKRLGNPHVTAETLTLLPRPAVTRVPVATKPAVVVKPRRRSDQSSKKINRRRPTATTTNGQGIRNEDLASDLLANVQDELRAAGKVDEAALLGGLTWALKVDESALELGVDARDRADVEALELVVLEALHGIQPELGLRLVEGTRPAPPETWSLAECLRWLVGVAGLSLAARPTEKNLGLFWAEACEVSPTALMQAATDFRAEEYWKNPDRAPGDWAVAAFICDGVWKSRLPKRLGLERSSARR